MAGRDPDVAAQTSSLLARRFALVAQRKREHHLGLAHTHMVVECDMVARGMPGDKLAAPVLDLSSSARTRDAGGHLRPP